MKIRAYQEPEIVYPEKYFESALIELIRCEFRGDSAYRLVPDSRLDIAIFVDHPRGSRTVFIEAKSFGGQRQGGVGFGNSNGQGPQVDILLSNGDQYPIPGSRIRWAIVNATLPRNTPRYALLTCSEARDAAMGGVARKKSNNFRLSALKGHYTIWPEFCERLLTFISGSETD